MMAPANDEETMMNRITTALACAVSMAGAALTSAAMAADCVDGAQVNGGVYRICMPAAGQYNGKLVIWAHGFQDAGTPVQIPEDQLQIGDTNLPDLITGLGYAFATNSYRKTGLAIAQGSEDIVDLVDVFVAQEGAPSRTYLVGASEGGIITALLAEQRPDLFDGGSAACGPVGSFPGQINYFGDARTLFEVFFPGLIPGPVFAPPASLVADWANYYESTVKPVVFNPANRAKLDQYAAAAKLPYDNGSDAEYLATVEVSVADVLRYSVVNLTDAATTLGGFPYGNLTRQYTGTSNDALLNYLVGQYGLRVARNPAALTEMQSSRYATSGELSVPLVTLHTLRDQQVPYWHEQLYAVKTLQSGDLYSNHIPLKVDRFEHCNFTAGEALVAFAIMVIKAEGAVQPAMTATLSTADLADFETLARNYGLPYRRHGKEIRIGR